LFGHVWRIKWQFELLESRSGLENAKQFANFLPNSSPKNLPNNLPCHSGYSLWCCAPLEFLDG